jgi:hypothetical protein
VREQWEDGEEVYRMGGSRVSFSVIFVAPRGWTNDATTDFWRELTKVQQLDAECLHLSYPSASALD